MMQQAQSQPLSTQRTRRHGGHREKLFSLASLRDLHASVISVLREVFRRVAGADYCTTGMA
jgi:hypothetical protein